LAAKSKKLAALKQFLINYVQFGLQPRVLTPASSSRCPPAQFKAQAHTETLMLLDVRFPQGSITGMFPSFELKSFLSGFFVQRSQ
jgi:hypothetical protein